MRARLAMVVGGTGAAALGYTAIDARADVAFAYLIAWAFAMSIALAALIFLMIAHVTAACWTRAYQARAEAITSTLPVLALMFAPIALCARDLYPWVAPSPDLPAEQLARLAHAAGYLNLPFWVGRAVAFLVVWVVLGELVVARRNPAVCAVGLPIVGLTLTFAASDWLMSLAAPWSSTIYGLAYFGGGFVGVLALLAMLSRLANSVTPAVSGALGRLLLSMLIFWAYLEYSQALIIWSGNKPAALPWYLVRSSGGWGGVLAALVAGGFGLPVAFLLPRGPKRRPGVLAAIGAWLVVAHYVDIYWLVMPAHRAQLAPDRLDLAAPCAVIGIATAVAQLRRHPVVDLAPARAYEGV